MKSLRILVVDDSKEVLIVVEGLLKQLEVKEVRCVQSGEEALDILQKGEYRNIDLIICDQYMSGLSGIETLNIIRKTCDKRSLPFIMISSDGTRENIIRLMANGGNKLVIKPPSLEVLKSKILEVLEKEEN